MGQDRESGASANNYGRAIAARVAEFLGTELLSPEKSNEANFTGKRIVIKAARRKTPEIVISLATLNRVQGIIVAIENQDGRYTLYRIDAHWYRAKMRPSRSHSPSAHKVMMVPCRAVQDEGIVIGVNCSFLSEET